MPYRHTGVMSWNAELGIGTAALNLRKLLQSNDHELQHPGLSSKPECKQQPKMHDGPLINKRQGAQLWMLQSPGIMQWQRSTRYW